MNNLVLAQASDAETSSGITSVPVSAEEAFTTTTVASDPNAAAPPTRTQRPAWTQFLPLILIFVIMYLFLFRGPRRKQQQHKKMVQTLQKNDKVRTIGGIVGTVVDIKDDDVILKIDESNNTKIRIASSAIGKNLSKED